MPDPFVEGELVVPDTVEPILAYRVWDVPPDATHLEAIARTITWTTEMEAICMQGICGPDDDVPCPPNPGLILRHRQHGCGIYGHKSFEQLLHTSWRTRGRLVYGEVLLWGNVWPYTEGYRAQFAQIHALYDSQPIDPRFGAPRGVCGQLAADYGVPLVAAPPVDPLRRPVCPAVRLSIWSIGAVKALWRAKQAMDALGQAMIGDGGPSDG